MANILQITFSDGFSFKKNVCLSCLSVCLTVCLSFCNDRSDVYAKFQGQKSKVKFTEIKTPISCFGTITPVWFHIRWWNDAQSLILFSSGALLVFKASVKFQGHAAKKNHRFWLKLGNSGLYLQFEITNDYPSNFKVTGLKQISILTQNLDFSDCNSSSNSQMAMKRCSNLEVA